MTLGDVIKTYRQAHGLSLESFSMKCGLSKGYIYVLEKNETGAGNQPVPSIRTYQRVAKAIDMDIDELIMKVERKIQEPPPPAKNLIPLRPMKQVPLIGQIACGTPILAGQNIIDYVDIPNHVSADYALTCKGDSMIGAGIQDGDVVYIKQQEEVENGQIAAVMVGTDEATLKRFYFDGKVLQLTAENSKYAPTVFIDEDINRVKVVGLAVAFTHILKH